MKRFHVHVSVADLDQSIRFYSTLFGAQPAVTKHDYAKWMLDDPRVNFAISTGRNRVGINHLGLQTDSDEELDALNDQLQRADLATAAEKNVACCYARSNKYWVQDPAGIAWETFHSLSAVPTYGEAATTAEAAPAPVEAESACGSGCGCSPAAAKEAGAATEAAAAKQTAAGKTPAKAVACCG